MPDVAMCEDKNCPSRDGCYRFKATPGEWQTYADFQRGDQEKCRAFIPVPVKGRKP